MCCHLPNNFFCGLGHSGIQISYKFDTFYHINQNLIFCGLGRSGSMRLILVRVSKTASVNYENWSIKIILLILTRLLKTT